MDLEEASGRDHHLLPVPAVFIIDREARIRFRYFTRTTRSASPARSFWKPPELINFKRNQA